MTKLRVLSNRYTIYIINMYLYKSIYILCISIVNDDDFGNCPIFKCCSTLGLTFPSSTGHK